MNQYYKNEIDECIRECIEETGSVDRIFIPRYIYDELCSYQTRYLVYAYWDRQIRAVEYFDETNPWGSYAESKVYQVKLMPYDGRKFTWPGKGENFFLYKQDMMKFYDVS